MTSSCMTVSGIFLIKKIPLVNKFFSEEHPPTQLLKLNLIADKESGWILVIMCLIDVIPIEEPLGPAVITLFLDESPLPTKVSFSLELAFALNFF